MTLAISGSDRSNRLSGALWAAVCLLTVIGVAGAALRLTITATTLATPPDRRTALSPIDQQMATFGATLIGMPPGTPASARVESVVARFANEYARHPAYAAMHLVLGPLILLLAPFQFSRRVRNRHIRFHRWSGRIILIASIGIVISALFFGVVRSSIHPAERPTIAIISALFVLSASRAYVAIRKKDVARHREWMIRTYAVLIGIAVVRVVALPVLLLFGGNDLGLLTMTSWWLGWSLTLGTAELWIRSTRRTSLNHVALSSSTGPVVSNVPFPRWLRHPF